MAPFVQVHPFYTRLLNQGLFRVPPRITSVVNLYSF
jgi:hypothetical protein